MEPIEAQADAIREALRFMPAKGAIMVGALPGQTVVIRYPRLPDVSDAELGRAIEREASQNLPYDLSEVFLDWTVLDRALEGEESVAKVLLVAAKNELIDSRVQVAEAAGIEYNILGVDSLALADAAEACDFLRVGETVALVDIGASSTIVHFVKDGVSNFYRDVNWGSKEVYQAVAKGRRIELQEAERLLREGEAPATDAEAYPTERDFAAMEAAPEAAEPSPSEAATDSGLEDLGGALDPLDEELGGGPAPAAPVSTPAPGVSEQSIEEIIHMPLTRLAGEIRRSFDYYEQQLYEHPVDRVIFSGGLAHMSRVRAALREELSLEEAELADPAQSALQLGAAQAIAPLTEAPALFMVAVGLAARGMAEL